jgi:hypothetical protein
MRVVLNSDVLFHQALVRERLSQGHVAFFEACKVGQHEVVVPLTSKLEFDRYQAQRRRETISSIRQAYGKLRRYEVPFEERDADELVPQPDLVELIKALGAEVNVVEPTDEELREAHRRACLHEAPHPPDAKSDEMRDLVIWMVALRVARESGGAVLVSRDNVHVGPAGDEEARRVDLVRRRTMDDALAYFGVATPVGQALLDVLISSWQELKNCGLPSQKNRPSCGRTSPYSSPAAADRPLCARPSSYQRKQPNGSARNFASRLARMEKLVSR